MVGRDEEMPEHSNEATGRGWGPSRRPDDGRGFETRSGPGWPILALTLLVASCGGGVTVNDDERQALADYEAAAEDSAVALDGVGEATATLAARLEDGSPDAMVDAALDAQTLRLTELEEALDALEDAETLLQHAHYGDAPGVRREALAGAVLYVLGAAALAVTMRALNDRMNEARTRRDAALEAEDFDAYADEQRTMAETGTQAAETLLTKVIPNPIDRVVSGIPGGQLVISTRDAVNDVSTLVATDACRVAPDSEECRIGATTADSESVLDVPAGTLQVSVTGPGLARTLVDGVEVPEGGLVTLDIDPIEHADIPGEGAGDVLHCNGTFGCFDNSNPDAWPGDSFASECMFEGGSPMPGPCP